METAAVAAFWAPKAGNSSEEYEDAFGLAAEGACFAVADGASEASFSGPWARLLTQRFVDQPPVADPGEVQEWVRPLQEEWARDRKGRAMAWYAEEKARGGAFSSLIGLTLDLESGQWQSLAIGDSCLFSVRGNKKIVAAFPLSRSEEFHNRPLLLSSLPSSNEKVWENLRCEQGQIARGDLFFLMTDALAEWFLVEAEMRRSPWAALRRLRTQEEFTAFLDLLRSGRALRNDDVTLVRIEVA